MLTYQPPSRTTVHNNPNQDHNSQPYSLSPFRKDRVHSWSILVTWQWQSGLLAIQQWNGSFFFFSLFRIKNFVVRNALFVSFDINFIVFFVRGCEPNEEFSTTSNRHRPMQTDNFTTLYFTISVLFAFNKYVFLIVFEFWLVAFCILNCLVLQL